MPGMRLRGHREALGAVVRLVLRGDDEERPEARLPA